MPEGARCRRQLEARVQRGQNATCSSFLALDRLTKCSQGESTLAQFITEFSNRLEDAIEVGFSDCMSACKWFVEVLEFDLRVAVMETLSSQLEGLICVRRSRLKLCVIWRSWPAAS